jgi:hypothetical protein
MLRLRVSCLEQAETVLGPLYESIEPSRPAEPRSRPANRTPRRRRGRGHVTRTQVCGYVIEHGPVTRSEVLEALGGEPKSIDGHLSRLLARGELGADGKRGARRYRPPIVPEVTPTPAFAPDNVRSAQTLPNRGVYPMYDAIVDLDGATTKQLVKRTGLPSSLVVEQGRRLMRLRLVRFTGVGDARVWLPAQPEIARDGA